MFYFPPFFRFAAAGFTSGDRLAIIPVSQPEVNRERRQAVPGLQRADIEVLGCRAALYPI
jgi:hypothetical protein